MGISLSYLVPAWSFGFQQREGKEVGIEQQKKGDRPGEKGGVLKLQVTFPWLLH